MDIIGRHSLSVEVLTIELTFPLDNQWKRSAADGVQSRVNTTRFNTVRSHCDQPVVCTTLCLPLVRRHSSSSSSLFDIDTTSPFNEAQSNGNDAMYSTVGYKRVKLQWEFISFFLKKKMRKLQIGLSTTRKRRRPRCRGRRKIKITSNPLSFSQAELQISAVG